ncbi:DEAD/DEAH box helicase family protein, partial [Parvimonas sp. M13]|uniref:DEAD/DEAH box helicase family protein n=2 Tax=unclassified Parvimonas TaxID=1151464 RepID=UPI002B4A148C
MFDPLSSHSFPREDITDQEIVAALGLPRYLDTIDFKAPQKLAINFGLKTDRFVLSFDKGMGKTITYLTIMHLRGVPKLLIICGKNAMLAQRREILRHFPAWAASYTFIRGNRERRMRQWSEDKRVYITTAQTLLADLGMRVPAAGQKQAPRIAPKWVESVAKVDDEFHKRMRTCKSSYFEWMKGAPHSALILSSGSAAGKGPQDLWPALHVCDKKTFRGYWPYVNTFCEVAEYGFGKQIVGVKNVNGWRRAVSPVVFHRRKDLKDYPQKTRSALEVEMEPWQQKIHDELR